ncbi:DDE superfamily endonuclease [Streptomyces sp. 2231.1]|nr:IS701 family transposase [Streptomyces sp. 2231.1]SEE72927.1 DDE superfamily endonuclease [Streptomyces sp. 2231.1]
MVDAGVWAAELESLFGRVAGRFSRVDLRWRMRGYVRGLLAPVARKNSWQLAEWAGHRDPAGMQHLLAGARWDADVVRDDVREYVGEKLGPGGVLIIDDTGFVKKGSTSAGVGRQYTGTSGKIDNCQIGVFAAYATSRGRALVDRELYLPKVWTADRERCRAAKIPDERAFATKGELAKAMVTRTLAVGLPAAWVSADEAYGQEWKFRRLLEELEVGYVVAVPKSQQVKSLAGFWQIDELIAQAPRAHPRLKGARTRQPRPHTPTRVTQNPASASPDRRLTHHHRPDPHPADPTLKTTVVQASGEVGGRGNGEGSRQAQHGYPVIDRAHDEHGIAGPLVIVLLHGRAGLSSLSGRGSASARPPCACAAWPWGAGASGCSAMAGSAPSARGECFDRTTQERDVGGTRSYIWSALGVIVCSQWAAWNASRSSLGTRPRSFTA